MAARLPFSAGGLDGAFTALVGTVIATERNSDSRVTGGGYTTSVNGQVFGNTNVTTDVTVTRDMWLHDVDGVEHHRRLQFDLPVRVGQRFAFIAYEGAIRASRLPAAYDLRISNLSMGRFHEVKPTKVVVNAMSRGAGEDVPTGIAAAWALSFFLCFVKGIGFLGFALLAWRHAKVGNVRVSENQVIRDIVESKFREMLALVDAEGVRLVPAPETPAGPQPQRGTAA